MQDTDTELATGAEPQAATVPPEAQTPQYVGVAGWLLLFCVSLTILNPIATIANFVWIYARGGDYIWSRLGTGMLVLGDTAISLAIAGFSVYVGVAMWRRRPKAVQTARLFLLCSMAYMLISPFAPLLLSLSPEGREAVLDTALTYVSRGVIYYVIWINYLLRSRRVRATFPDWRPPVATGAPAGKPARWYHVVAAVVALVAFIALVIYISSLLGS